MKLNYSIIFSIIIISQYKLVSSADYPDCTGCTLYASGIDGHLWGWENNNFCKIPDSCSSSKSNSNTTSEKTNSKSSEGTNNATKKTATATASTTQSDSIDITSNTNSNVSPNDIITNNNNGNVNGGIVNCNECDVVATGGDGVLYGFENGSSCQIDNKKCEKAAKATKEKEERDAGGILICNHCNPDSTADDKTLWGHQNGESCRVIGSRCHINISEHPYCSGCAITATGTDSSLWGWENEASCMIDEQACGIKHDNDSTNFDENSGSYSIIANLYIAFVAVTVTLIIYGY